MFVVEEQFHSSRRRYAIEGPTTTVQGLNREQIARVVAEWFDWTTDATGAVYGSQGVAPVIASTLEEVAVVMETLGWFSRNQSGKYTTVNWERLPTGNGDATAQMIHRHLIDRADQDTQVPA